MSKIEMFVIAYLLIGVATTAIRFISYVCGATKKNQKVAVIQAIEQFCCDLLFWWLKPLEWLRRMFDTRGRVSPPFIFHETWGEYDAALQQLRKGNKEVASRSLQLQVRSAEISSVARIASIPTAEPASEETLMPFYLEALRNVREVLSMPPVKMEEGLLREFRDKEAARVARERVG